VWIEITYQDRLIGPRFVHLLEVVYLNKGEIHQVTNVKVESVERQSDSTRCSLDNLSQLLYVIEVKQYLKAVPAEVNRKTVEWFCLLSSPTSPYFYSMEKVYVMKKGWKV